MKDLKALLAKLRAEFGDAHKDLLDELDAAVKEHGEALDAEKAAKVDAEKKVSDAEKAKTKAEKAAKKAADDLEAKTKGEGEETTKLRSERDQFKAAVEAAEKKSEDLHREFRLREELVTKHDLVDPEAVKLFDTSGITLDKTGALVGLDSVVSKWKESKPWAFRASDGDDKGQGEGAGGGAGSGAGKLPKAGDKKGAGGGTNQQKTPDELARESLERTGYLRTAQNDSQRPAASPNILDSLLGR